jgi:hypothetical protein
MSTRPKGSEITCSRKVFIRYALPYGQWLCADGREVLFDRKYVPIYQRYPGQLPTPADPKEWVQYQHQEWFYNDGTPEAAKRKASLKVLEAWGIAEQVMSRAEQMEKTKRVTYSRMAS